YFAAALLLALFRPALATNQAATSPLYWTYQYVLATSDDELAVAQMVCALPRAHPEMCDRAMLDMLAEFFAHANVTDPNYERGMREVFTLRELGEDAAH